MSHHIGHQKSTTTLNNVLNFCVYRTPLTNCLPQMDLTRMYTANETHIKTRFSDIASSNSTTTV